MDVSIVIINYNTLSLLKNCLNSIYAITAGVTFETIVVDNASVDGSQQMLINSFPQVKLVASETNLGFGVANNLGVKHAKGQFVFLLNSDTILLNNAVKLFYDFFQNFQEEEFVIAGSILLDANLFPTHSSGNFPSKFKIVTQTLANYISKASNLKLPYEKLLFENEKYFQVDYITGADLFIKKKTFDLIEGFDPIFFMYYEDTDFQMRLKKIGFKSILIEGPRIIHLEGGSNFVSVFSANRRIMITNSMFKYFKKHSLSFTYYLFKFVYFIIRTPVLFDKRIKFKERAHYLFSILD